MQRKYFCLAGILTSTVEDRINKMRKSRQHCRWRIGLVAEYF